MVTFALKLSRNEQHAVTRFLRTKSLDAKQIHLRCILWIAVEVWCTKSAFWTKNKHQILWCNQLFVGGFDSSQHRSLHQAFRNLLTDRTNV